MGDLLERGYAYHANVIYNLPKLKHKRNTDPDWVVSLDVVKYVVDLMASWGYDRTYYHDRDAMPGENIFSEFFSAVNKSMYTIVIVTRGFIEDCWAKYKSQSAFVKLLESNKSRRFIAVFINLENYHIPDELTAMETLVFSNDWKTETDEWDKLRDLLSGFQQPITDTGSNKTPVSETGQSLKCRKKYFAGPPSNIEPKAGRTGYGSRFHALTQAQHSTYKKGEISGVQDTNPPDLTALFRGQDITKDSPGSIDMGENGTQGRRSQNTDPKQLVSFDESSLNREDVDIDQGAEGSIPFRSKGGKRRKHKVWSEQDQVPDADQTNVRRQRLARAKTEPSKWTDSGLDTSSLQEPDDDGKGPGSIGAKRVIDTTPSPTGSDKALPQEESSLFKKMTDLVTDKDKRSSMTGNAIRLFANIFVKADQSFI